MPSHKHIFAKYLNKYFIETGTFEGQGVEYALDVGFDHVRSVDINYASYTDNLVKFNYNPRVQLYHGPTETKLWEMIKDIDVPATFWLDAHWSGEGTPMSDKKCPLLEELEVIKNHLVKNHTIMIDDIRCCGTDYFDFITKEQLEAKVREINPNYVITYEDSWEKNDIMVCRIL